MDGKKEHVVIFSHGFGVRKDAGGLFTDIAKELFHHHINAVMFDYNEIDESRNEVTVKPFSKQAEMLQAVIDKTVTEHPNATIDLISHSQGTVMTALVDLRSVRKVIIIAPFFHTDVHKVLERYTKFSASEINLQGTSRRRRSDGSTTIIPQEYWTERFATDIVALYNNLALNTDLTIIAAGEDEVIDQFNLALIFNASIINIHGDHDFSREYRIPLLKRITALVQ